MGAAVACVLLAACDPVSVPAGPNVQAPELAADHVVMSDGVRLPIHVWVPVGEPTGLVVAVHGFNDYGKAFEAAAASWARRGIQTYAYDQRGFGGAPDRGYWSGAATLVSDLSEVAELVRDAHPGTPLFLVGHSMGAAVVMTAMGDDPAPDADGIVLAAPAVWGWQTMNPAYRTVLWTAAHVAPGVKLSGPGFGSRLSDNRDMLISLRDDPLFIRKMRVDSVYGLVNLMDLAFSAAPKISVPVLVVYGANERILPSAPICEMLRRLAAPLRVAVYPDGHHMLLRDLHADIVRTDIAAWITAPATALPSGNDRDRSPVADGC